MVKSLSFRSSKIFERIGRVLLFQSHLGSNLMLAEDPVD